PSKLRLGGFYVAINADKFRGLVFDRRYPLLFLRVPPFVRNDAMSAGVAPGEKGGVSGSGAGVGVVVVAIGEISAAIEKHAETSVAELVAIAFQVVAAELVDHDDDHELGAGVVGGRECARDQAEQHQRHEHGTGESHCELVYRRSRSPRRDRRPRLSRRAQLASVFVRLPSCSSGGSSPRQTAEGGCPYVVSKCTESRFSAKVKAQCSI